MNGLIEACVLHSTGSRGCSHAFHVGTRRNSAREFSRIGKRRAVKAKNATSRLCPLRIAGEICVARHGAKFSLSGSSARFTLLSFSLPLSPSSSAFSLSILSLASSLLLRFLISSSLRIFPRTISLHFSSLCSLSISLYLPSQSSHFFSLLCSPLCSIPSLSSFSLPRSYFLSCARTHAYTYLAPSRCSAGTKTDRTVSIVPVSIRFGRVRPNKQQRRVYSTVRPLRNASLKSEFQSSNTEELRDFKRVRERIPFVLRIRGSLAEG